MKTLVLLLVFSCLTLQAKTRCAQTFDGVKKAMSVAKRNRLQFVRPIAAKVSQSLVVPFYAHTVEFDTVEPVNVLGVEESTDLQVWNVVYIDDPHLWIGFGHHKVSFTTQNKNAYWKVFVRNTP